MKFENPNWEECWLYTPSTGKGEDIIYCSGCGITWANDEKPACECADRWVEKLCNHMQEGGGTDD